MKEPEVTKPTIREVRAALAEYVDALNADTHFLQVELDELPQRIRLRAATQKIKGICRQCGLPAEERNDLIYELTRHFGARLFL